LRVLVLLPQGVYPTDMREVTIAHTGGDLYGNLTLPRHLGDLSYTAYAGRRGDSMYSGYPYLFFSWMVFFRELGGLQYGGDLRWNTPVKGLTVKGKFINLLNPYAGLLPYECSTKKDWTNQFYTQFLYRRFRLDGEYRRLFDYVPYIPGADVSTDIYAWYIAGSYRIHKRVEVGSYYSRYTDRGFAGGILAAVVPNDTDLSHPKNHVYDKVVAARVDLNRFVYLKIEGHFMDGYGMGSYPDGFYPQQKPVGSKPLTNALVVKTGFHF